MTLGFFVCCLFFCIVSCTSKHTFLQGINLGLKFLKHEIYKSPTLWKKLSTIDLINLCCLQQWKNCSTFWPFDVLRFFFNCYCLANLIWIYFLRKTLFKLFPCFIGLLFVFHLLLIGLLCFVFSRYDPFIMYMYYICYFCGLSFHFLYDILW